MDNEQERSMIKKQYPLSRDFHASARLQIQHLLWNIRLGYLLHPSIPTASYTSLRIADVGTGNALWPLELSRHLPSTTQIFGYDISTAQFPATEWLPPNVHLGILDILGGELPKELKSAFDVVHLRAFAVVIKGGDPTGVLDRLVEMLKPGGYLQWDEVDIGAYQAHSPSAEIGNVSCQRLAEHFLAYVDVCEFKFDWTHNLPHIFATNPSLTAIQATELPIDDTWSKFETDDHLMALEDTLEDMIGHVSKEMVIRKEGDDDGKEGRVGEEKSRKQVEGEIRMAMQSLLKGAVEEAGKGVGLRMRWYSCVGRKKSR